jgi:hypothetical protein
MAVLQPYMQLQRFTTTLKYIRPADRMKAASEKMFVPELWAKKGG